MTNRKPVVDELLQRAKQEAKVVENEQTRVMAKFKMPDDALPDFEEEKPTKPGKNKADEQPSIIPRAAHSEPPELLDLETSDEAVLRPDVEVSGLVQKAEVLRFSSRPAEHLEPQLVPMRAARWPRIVLALLTPAAIIVTALALMRHFGH